MPTEMSSATRKRDWSLTPTAFDRLLAALGPERDRAALEYERLRERVSGLLRWWGCPSPDELADETLDRVARKLEEGADIPPRSLGAYVRGVARLVFYEESRRRASEHPLDLMGEPAVVEEGREDLQPALNCLDRCLGELDPADRSTILRYYGEGGERNIEARRKLAAELGVSGPTLRLRAHRLRERLERGVLRCLEGG